VFLFAKNRHFFYKENREFLFVNENSANFEKIKREKKPSGGMIQVEV